jgi:hypothetical protein
LKPKGKNPIQTGCAVYAVLDCEILSAGTIHREAIPCTAFYYGDKCHEIKLRVNSALIVTVTVKSEGVFAPLEWCLCHLDSIIIVMNLLLTQYSPPCIVYVFSFSVDIPASQNRHRCKANNDIFSMLRS